jgi:1,4-dihydroxy-2-naphthoate polyprenyltransferase
MTKDSMTTLPTASWSTWWMAIRPKTLTATTVPVLVGTALVVSQGRLIVSPWLAVSLFLSALFIQIATNLLNDAIDFKKGTDTHERLGPTRVTQAGLIPIKSVFQAGWGCLFLAVVFGAPVVVTGGWPILTVGVLSLFLAYGYTGGPVPLAYLGLGDLFVFLFFGLVAVLGTEYVLSGWVTSAGIVAGAQVGCLATVLIAINNMRDSDLDRNSGKMTLPARFGIGFARTEIASLYAVSFLLGLAWFLFEDMKIVALLPLISAPLSLSIVRKVLATEPSRDLNHELGRSALAHQMFGLCLAGAFFLERMS